MKRLLFLISLGLVVYAADNNSVSTPISIDTLSGKSVYIPPSKPVEVEDNGCVQKEDQNVTGHGGAKKW